MACSLPIKYALTRIFQITLGQFFIRAAIHFDESSEIERLKVNLIDKIPMFGKARVVLARGKSPIFQRYLQIDMKLSRFSCPGEELKTPNLQGPQTPFSHFFDRDESNVSRPK